LENDDLLLEMMTTLKLKVKLGQLFGNFPHLMKVMEKSLMKIKTNQVMDACKISIIKAEDFDEAILVVQVRVGKFKIRDVLLDRGSGVNVISKSL
jgi:N-acetylmuramic acid 6-phosphate (MurNAc-6-P) etherase